MEDFDYEARKAALIEEITAAFDGVQREDGITFHEASALDGGGFPQERAAARAKDLETRWQDVPDETFRSNDPNLSFLDSKGFRYYLPALAIWYLRYNQGEDPIESDWNIFHDFMYHLATGYRGDIADHYLSWFECFSKEQSKAIAIFLVFESDLHADKNAQQALDRYWGQFL